MGDFFRRIYYLLNRRKLEQELQNDMEVHREMLGEQGRRDFGNPTLLQERSYEAWGWAWLDHFLQDVRYGWRVLRKNPGYTLVALLALGLGIGVNTALFSVVYGVLLKPLPYASGQQLVVLRQEFTKANRDKVGFSVKEIADYRAQSRSMSELEEYHGMGFILLDGKEPKEVSTGVVSAHFFDLLGIKPYVGRFFVDSDDKPGSEGVLILSYPFWMKNYGGDRDIIGRRFRMNDKVHTVIGVLPPIPQYPGDNDVYMPTVACPWRSSQQMIESRDDHMLFVLGRLKNGENVEAGRRDMALIAARLEQSYPESYPAVRGFTATLDGLQSQLTKEIRPMLLVLLGTAGLVLLIACANVANLALARMMRREQELAVRAAMGASRSRLVRQLLTESTMLSLAGGALGLWLAAGCLSLLVAFAERFTTRAAEVSVSLPVLLFTLVISLATGLIFGSFPAFSQRLDLVNSLKEGSNAATERTSSHRMRNLLAVGQVAISFMLLIAAGLMIRSFIRLQQVDAGYNSENVLSASIFLNFSKYGHGMVADKTAVKNFFDRVTQKLKSTPGIDAVAMVSGPPLAPGRPSQQPFYIEGRPTGKNDARPTADVEMGSPDSFQLLGVPLISGRFFTPHDNTDSPIVVVVNQSFARHYFPDEDPLGKRISDDQKDWAKIVGVVGDIRRYGLDKDPVDTVYLAFAQEPQNMATLVIKTAGDPASYARYIREAVYAADPEQPISRIKTLDELRGETLAATRLTSVLLGLFAMLALAIAATGLSGVTSLLVSQRTREIGIRLALGAQRDQVLRMVLMQGMRVIAIGLAVGVVGALLTTRAMQSLLFKTGVTDPLTFLGVALVLLVVAWIASYIPARRVTRVDPMIALRSE